MPDAVHELLATEVELTKLGARDISAEEVAQLPHRPKSHNPPICRYIHVNRDRERPPVPAPGDDGKERVARSSAPSAQCFFVSQPLV